MATGCVLGGLLNDRHLQLRGYRVCTGRVIKRQTSLVTWLQGVYWEGLLNDRHLQLRGYRVCTSSGERFASHYDILDYRGSNNSEHMDHMSQPLGVKHVYSTKRENIDQQGYALVHQISLVYRTPHM